MPSYALRVTCPSTRGIVAAIAGYLSEQGCNITDSAQEACSIAKGRWADLLALEALQSISGRVGN